MAANPTVVFDAELWASITKAANRRRKKPQSLVEEVMRDYLEREADFAWWRSVQREYRGREMSDAEAVEFVHKLRQEKRQLTNNGPSQRVYRTKSAAPR